MVKSVIKGAILAGMIVFAWNFISWMVLPWHKDTYKKFTNEQYVASTIKANAPKAGVYSIPTMDMKEPAMAKKMPFIFACVAPDGVDMTSKRFLLVGLLTQMIAGGVVGAILHLSCCHNFWKKVSMVLLLCVFTGLVAYVPSWNWLQFPTDYILVMWADLLISWFLASLVLASLIKPCRESRNT